MTATVNLVGSIPAQQAAKAATGDQVNPWKDPRYLALRNFAMSITVFNIFGYTVLGWEQPWLWPIFAILTAYTTEVVLEVISAKANHREYEFAGRGHKGMMAYLLPAHITGLAANMLLYANNQWWPVMFCVVVAVAQKHILKAPVAGRMRHFMNPSNFGITVSARLRSELVREYVEKLVHPYFAAELGLVDDVIDPVDTRSAVASGLAMLRGKRKAPPQRKHGNVPL